ncbi:MAG: AAA family ATPase, partial [Deltaproteobacteria bacterium]|nr:AAA family ATPase [Deltaproteobacteria bacterium]
MRRDGRPVAEHVTDRRLTTTKVLSQEQRLQKWARRSARPAETSAGDLQADAAAAMASHDDLVVVVGPAGTGKTHTTARAVASLREQGRAVVGLAPSGKAADVLARETGCETQTLAAFLARHNGLGRRDSLRLGTTIILDEAAMASIQDLANLVALAEKRWWQIVAVGDPAQLPAVGRGGTFAHWCETLPHHRLDTPRRFHNQWEADASLALRSGDPAAAAVYADHQRLHTTHPALLARQIALAHKRQVDGNRTVAITTTTAEMARTINQAIQARRGHTRSDWSAKLADGSHVYAGDQIATRRNNPALTTDEGHQVRNRHTWTVQEVTHKGDLVVTDPDRGTVTLPT